MINLKKYILFKYLLLTFLGLLLNKKAVTAEDAKENKKAHSQYVQVRNDPLMTPGQMMKFRDLLPEEQKEYLSKIIEKIDTDNDGFVNQNELVKSILNVQKQDREEHVNEMWALYNKNNDEMLSWEVYSSVAFRDGPKLDPLEMKKYPDIEDKNVKMQAKDFRRFSMVDRDQNQALDKRELADFLFPEHAKDGGNALVSETLELFDKNNDEKVSLEEYIEYAKSIGDEDFTNKQVKDFEKNLDLTKDRFLDKDEIRLWLISGKNVESVLSDKYMFEVDLNQDEKISKMEFFKKYKLFHITDIDQKPKKIDL